MVPPSSHGIPRVPRYSGYHAPTLTFKYGTLTLFGLPSHAVLLVFVVFKVVRTPKALLLSVWPLPRSLATTYGISVDFSSSPYLDVSVQAVPSVSLCIHDTVMTLAHHEVSPFGNPRITVYLLLPVAYRSLSRPSSAPSVKAFTLCSFQLNLLLRSTLYIS